MSHKRLRADMRYGAASAASAGRAGRGVHYAKAGEATLVGPCWAFLCITATARRLAARPAQPQASPGATPIEESISAYFDRPIGNAPRRTLTRGARPATPCDALLCHRCAFRCVARVLARCSCGVLGVPSLPVFRKTSFIFKNWVLKNIDELIFTVEMFQTKLEEWHGTCKNLLNFCTK